MLIQTQQDLQDIRNIVREEVHEEITKQLIPIDQKIDKVLQIVTTTQQELTIIASKLEAHIDNKATHHTHTIKTTGTPTIFA